ncbi:hypothetical protein, partial [Mycobacterium szulgai]|uniref:hypothetical protein n=1 Tax=Mycobacterium szulgai TaxID=1787 RepID=UPI0021F2D5C3
MVSQLGQRPQQAVIGAMQASSTDISAGGRFQPVPVVLEGVGGQVHGVGVGVKVAPVGTMAVGVELGQGVGDHVQIGAIAAQGRNDRAVLLVGVIGQGVRQGGG